MLLGNHGNGKLQVKPYRDFTADSGRGRFGRKNPIPGPSQNLTLVQHEPCPGRFASPLGQLRQGISRRSDWPLAEKPSGLGSCRAGHAHSGCWEPRASASPPACPEKVWWGGHRGRFAVWRGRDSEVDTNSSTCSFFLASLCSRLFLVYAEGLAQLDHDSLWVKNLSSGIIQAHPSRLVTASHSHSQALVYPPPSRDSVGG